MARGRFHRRERFVLGAFGNRRKRSCAKSQNSRLSAGEMDWVCTLCFYDHRPAMTKVVKPNILEMKSKDIRAIVARLNERLADKHLGQEKRQLFENIRAKFFSVLEQRLNAAARKA